MKIKYIDLFAGIGGFHYGIDKANKNFECVYSSEWDKYAADVYDKQFHTAIDRRDIATVPSSDIPDHDLLVGGFPCQAFSIAGKRRGFDDTRGTLFFEVARILRDKKPKYFILENVKGLLSHDQGRTIQTIFGVLSDLGYEYQWQVLNSKNFGVPQNRERIFIIGNLRGISRPKIFPIGESSGGNIKGKQDDSEISRTVSARFKKGVGNTESRIVDVLINVAQAQRIRSIDGLASTLQGLAGGQGAKTGLYAIPVLTPDRIEKRQNGRRFKEDGDPSFTLTGQDRHGVMTGISQIRRLTPTECARLQGFPDNWCEGLSDSQQYKCFGNAVSTPVVTYLISKLSIDKFGAI